MICAGFSFLLIWGFTGWWLWVLGCRGWERCRSRLFVSYDYLAEQNTVPIGVVVEEETTIRMRASRTS